MISLLEKALSSVRKSELAYCKFLSSNDTKATNAHQSGYLVGKNAWSLFLDTEPSPGENIKSYITIRWQDDFETSSVFTYYGAAKNEFRLTRFGRNFPFREETNAGDLFILCKIRSAYFEAFVLSGDDDIESFFDSLNISASESNKIIYKEVYFNFEQDLLSCLNSYIHSIQESFPPSVEVSLRARNCYNAVYKILNEDIIQNPDLEIVNWLNTEYELFKLIENKFYGSKLNQPFSSLNDLIDFSNSILNRRKSRAGKSLEHHLSAIFKINQMPFSSGGHSEDKKKPDFIFPGVQEYHNMNYDEKRLVFLASKTTCKDRWRQVLNEADRIKTKHLFTLQQGISLNQLKEMYKYNVCLVVPSMNIDSFPKEFRDKILSLSLFIKKVKNTHTEY